MILEQAQIEALAKDAEASPWIIEARKLSTNYKMHFYGTGLTEHLTQATGLENAEQIKLRRQYAISNKALIHSLLQPVNAAWAAKGGMVNIDAADDVKEKIKEGIENNKGHKTPRDYLQNVWFDRFVTDPNGLLFVESNDTTAYPVYKSIFDINKMEVNGVQPEYIVFEPHLREEIKGKFTRGGSNKQETFWIVDDAFYYEVKRGDDSIEILKKIPNVFEKVPAIQNSPIEDTEKRIKVSPIDKQIELLEAYLIDNSVNNIYKKLHGFPVFAFYAPICDSCKGTGEIGGDICSSCNGSTQNPKRDVSNGIPLKTPKDKDSPVVKPSEVVAYIQPALETLNEQRVELEHMTHMISFSMWGTTKEKADNETATGRWIDSQPVTNVLHHFSDVFENVNSWLLNTEAKYHAPNSTVSITVTYGRRYLIETTDQLMERYQETLAKGADQSTKDLQLEQFYETEFQTDEFMLKYYLKLIKVEPLVHYSIDAVLGMPVSDKIKNTKVSFTTWKTITPMLEVIDTDVDKLIIQLDNYSNGKSNINEDEAKLQGDAKIRAAESKSE